MTPPTALIRLDALGHSGPFRSRTLVPVCDVAGRQVAALSLVPPLFVQLSMAALRKAHTLPAAERNEALARAGRLFATGTLDGLSPEAYRQLVSRVSGLPRAVVDSATDLLASAAEHAFDSTRFARPAGAADSLADPLLKGGRALWTRRGDVFSVLAAGNHPGVHALWLEALALGYRVAVRPSRREPFTPHRLVSALRAAGFPEDHVVLLPTDHSAADGLVRGADLSIAYGGDELVRKYAGNPAVLPQGPGRSKILVTGGDWRPYLDTIVSSVADQGGTACVNATAVFVEGDPAPLARAIAERLSALPSLPPQDPEARLPVQPVAVARAYERALLAHAEGTVRWLGGDGVVDELGDGSAVLRPAVFQLDRPGAPQAGVELGFPCVWVAPWSKADGTVPLRNTLVLTAVTEDEELIARLVDEPTIANVYVGDHPTWWTRPGVPHDGHLAEFLMRTKAVIRG